MNQAINGYTLAQFAADKQLTVEFLKTLGLKDANYYGVPSIRIPYYNAQGLEQAVRFRIARTGDRFRWEKGSKPPLYCNPRMGASGNGCILVEGDSSGESYKLAGDYLNSIILLPILKNKYKWLYLPNSEVLTSICKKYKAKDESIYEDIKTLLHDISQNTTLPFSDKSELWETATVCYNHPPTHDDRQPSKPMLPQTIIFLLILVLTFIFAPSYTPPEDSEADPLGGKLWCIIIFSFAGAAMLREGIFKHGDLHPEYLAKWSICLLVALTGILFFGNAILPSLSLLENPYIAVPIFFAGMIIMLGTLYSGFSGFNQITKLFFYLNSRF